MCRIVHTHKMCKSVRGEFCANLSWRSFCQCVRRVCVRELCRRKVSGDAHQKVLCAWTLSDMCAESFRHVCAQICANCTCPELCADCPMCKCPKMTKNDQNDQNWQFGQNVPKWPKMAQNAENVPGGYMTGHRPPAISYTGWQKLPEYALIRIAAGPKVADLPLCAHVQKSPISAPRPDGKSRRFAHVQKSPLSVCTCVQVATFRAPPAHPAHIRIYIYILPLQPFFWAFVECHKTPVRTLVPSPHSSPSAVALTAVANFR